MAMSENEAIKWLREMQNPVISEAELYCAETYYGSGKMVYPEPEDYVFETAIHALSEIQEYRAIGTIEEFKAYKQGDCMNDCEHYDNCANYIYSKGYNQGTIDRAEELQKCREYGYNKAIDECYMKAKTMMEELAYQNQGRRNGKTHRVYCIQALEFLIQVAEQMKGEKA